jgi:hypothetical protein
MNQRISNRLKQKISNGHVFFWDYELLILILKWYVLMDGDFFISEDHDYLDKLIVTLAKKN